MGSNLTSFYKSTGKVDYERKFKAEEPNIVQSSCEAVLKNVLESDFRLVKVERSLKPKVKAGMENQALLDILRVFPFRTEYTVALSVMEIANLQKCTSIFDGPEVVNCADPPPPESAASISISVILMVLIITAWVFGCLFAKKFDKGDVIVK